MLRFCSSSKWLLLLSEALGGFMPIGYVPPGGNVVSPPYRCIPNKKGSEEPLESDLVAQVHSN